MLSIFSYQPKVYTSIHTTNIHKLPSPSSMILLIRRKLGTTCLNEGWLDNMILVAEPC